MGELDGLAAPAAEAAPPVQPTVDLARSHPAGPTTWAPGAPPPSAGAHPALPPPVTTRLLATRPGIVPLRPLGVGDILEGAFGALRTNPRTFLGLSLLSGTAILLLAALVVGAVLLVSLAAGDDSLLSTALAAGVGAAAAAGTALLGISLGQVLSGMLAYPVGEAVLGRHPGLAETWRRTRRSVLRLTGLALVVTVSSLVLMTVPIVLTVWAFSSSRAVLGAVGVVVTLSLLAALAWVVTRLTLACPVLVLEELGVRASVRRAWVLTRGRFWRTFGILLLANVLAGVVTQVLGTVLQVLALIVTALATTLISADNADTIAGVVAVVVSVSASLLTSLAVTPFLAAVYALLAIDSRIRLEAFDLDLQRAAGR